MGKVWLVLIAVAGLLVLGAASGKDAIKRIACANQAAQVSQ